jgi:hypothetical protein
MAEWLLVTSSSSSAGAPLGTGACGGQSVLWHSGCRLNRKEAVGSEKSLRRLRREEQGWYGV